MLCWVVTLCQCLCVLEEEKEEEKILKLRNTVNPTNLIKIRIRQYKMSSRSGESKTHQIEDKVLKMDKMPKQ